jgi:hypothetical protein
MVIPLNNIYELLKLFISDQFLFLLCLGGVVVVRVILYFNV